MKYTAADIKSRFYPEWLNALKKPGDMKVINVDNGDEFIIMKTDGEKLTRVQKARLKKGLTINGFTPEQDALYRARMNNPDKSKNKTFTLEEWEEYGRQHGIV
jgi:hypothetical protein